MTGLQVRQLKAEPFLRTEVLCDCAVSTLTPRMTALAPALRQILLEECLQRTAKIFGIK
jgi:hypothetical protein